MYRLSLFLALLILSAQTRAQSSSDVLEDALSGVVTVAVYQTAGVSVRPLGVRGKTVNPEQAYAKALSLTGAKSSGSGFVIELNGQKYVLTNAHVVESATDATGSLAVFSINQQKYPVRVVGGDALYDFAVLAFTTPPGPELTALPLRSAPARIGERVYAIGNPQGEYPYTVTDGIISAKNRMRGGLTGKFGFLQTTATVIWGNSGGPLVDERGAVLGINSQIAFANGPNGSSVWLSQINFALETSVVLRLLNDVLTNDGLVRRAYLGLEFSETTRISDDDERPQAAPSKPVPVLSGMLPDSPGKDLLKGYIGQTVTAINGEEVRNVQEVLGILETLRPGSMVALTFGHGPSATTVSVISGTLTPVELESVARYVLTSNRLALTESPDGIAIRFMQDNNTYELDRERRYQKTPAGFGQKQIVSPSANTPRTVTYRVVAAGIQSERGSKLWRVSKLSYLGAVCRLMGLSGVVDMAVADPDNPDDVRFTRHMLSGEQDVIKACLWY
ncbi:S1-C subfamily serine protease [Spirosoma lacussanchae]|uniref:S1C family serine protease n=1 Tax=Spirosoma lacussanchae TaxID=1884249 RepID=UPI0011088E22|nr:trypsin-like peptidase domain-containing protein [Spirosoma lacussanchae]